MGYPEPERKRSGATTEQLRAVYEVMRILAEDDRDRAGVAGVALFCDSCGRDRPAAGSVEYAGHRLCNGCATDYEVLRISGHTADVQSYLASRGAAPAAAG